MSGIITNLKIRPELLAPAGDYECFLAALSGGADAVYLAGKCFGARASAKNFEKEEIERALDIAHLNNRKIYLTVNTLLKDDEINSLYDYIQPFYVKGLDAVIVQDLGVISYIKDRFDGLDIHASTQLAITDTDAVLKLRDMGVQRVVTARELSLEEIRLIKKETGMSIECFVHGAMCYSISGKCLFSSLVGGRSGNRGRCAQPCRLPYNNEYPISMKDMYTLKILPDLIEAGIDSFKIEGRMKSPDYVYEVSRIYGKYIDRALDSPDDYCVDINDEKRLLGLYTRSGNCSGYYYSKNSRDMITISLPGYNSEGISAKEDNRHFVEDLLKCPIDIKCTMSADVPFAVEVSAKGVSVCCDGEIPSKAVNKAVSAGDLEKQLRKLGNTVFCPNSITINCDEDLFLPISCVNECRRKAVDSLITKLNNEYFNAEEYKCSNDLAACIDETIGESVCAPAKDVFDIKPAVRVYISNSEQLNSVVLLENVDGIILPIELEHLCDCAKLVRDKGKKLYIALMQLSFGRNRQSDKKLYHLLDIIEPEGLYLRNLEQVNIFENSKAYERIADLHLYCLNQRAHEYFDSLDIKTTVPVELNEKELYKRGIYGEDMIVYGRLPMMITTQCVHNTINSGCRKTNNGRYEYLTDRYNNKFPVFCNCRHCSNVIYNNVPLSWHNERILFELKPSVHRFIFTTESSDEVERIITSFYNGRYDSKGKFTRGHLRRGVE